MLPAANRLITSAKDCREKDPVTPMDGEALKAIASMLHVGA